MFPCIRSITTSTRFILLALVMLVLPLAVFAQGDQAAVTAARRWCERELAHLVDADAGHRAESATLERSQ